MQDAIQNKDMQLKANQKIQKLKTLLREGSSEESFDNYGILLQGYTALLKVVQIAGLAPNTNPSP